MKPRSNSDLSFCIVCQDYIQDNPSVDEERSRVLDCNHIFHRECVGAWLEHQHTCPLCRAAVVVDTPVTTSSEMTLQQNLDDPDFRTLIDNTLDIELVRIRTRIREIRQVRQLRLDENTTVSRTAAKVNAIAQSFFSGRG